MRKYHYHPQWNPTIGGDMVLAGNLVRYKYLIGFRNDLYRQFERDILHQGL